MRKTSYFLAFLAVLLTLVLVSALFGSSPPHLAAPCDSYDPSSTHPRPAPSQNILSVQRPDWSVPGLCPSASA